MKIRKGFFLYSEKHERITVRARRRSGTESDCRECGQSAGWYRVPEVFEGIEIEDAEVAATILKKDFHIRVDDSGEVLICERSLRGYLTE